MTGHGTKFGRKKEAAIAALLGQRNIEEAARAAGIGTKTLLRWLEIPEFKKAYLEARRQAVGQAIARLQQTAGAAVSTLQKLIVDAGTPASTKARVAAVVLALGIKGLETDDIEMRVAELERAADQANPRR